MPTPNWKKVNAQAIATSCSPANIASVIEDAQRDIALLAGVVRRLLKLHEAHHNSIEHAAAREVLRCIDGE